MALFLFLSAFLNLPIGKDTMQFPIMEGRIYEPYHKEFIMEKPRGILLSIDVSNTCGDSKNTVKVSFIDCDCKFFVPNAFTPNHDGHNDLFASIEVQCCTIFQ
jgi:hypothetical protein